jgi:hypothetical protein
MNGSARHECYIHVKAQTAMSFSSTDYSTFNSDNGTGGSAPPMTTNTTNGRYKFTVRHIVSGMNACTRKLYGIPTFGALYIMR